MIYFADSEKMEYITVVREILSFTQEDEFIKAILELHGTVYLLGTMDLFVEKMSARKVPGMVNGVKDDIYSFSTGNITVRPVSAILPLSWREIALLSAQSGKESRTDVESVLNAYSVVNTVFLSGLADTIPSTIFQDFQTYTTQQNIAKHIVRLPDEIHKQSRLAYYGGRTEVFQNYCGIGAGYDINSSYNSAMTKKLPIGKWKLIQGPFSTDSIKNGVYLCRVSVSDEKFIAPLPYRVTINELMPDKLYYPVGKWLAWYTAPEIRHALRHNAQIEIVQGIQWETTDNWLAPWAQILYRQKTQANPVLSKIVKLAINSLVGKFGQSYLVQGLYYGNPRRGARVRETGIKGLYQTYYRQIPECANYPVASYITSYGRIALLNGLNAADYPVYCDTDSVYCQRFPDEKKGTGLGEWKVEKEFQAMEILSGKLYSWQDLAGTWHTTRHFKDREDFLNAYKNKIFNNNIKWMTGLSGNRKWQDNISFPYDVDEIKKESLRK